MLLPELTNSLNIKLYALDNESVESWWNFHNVVSPFTRLYYVVDSNKTYVEHGGKRYNLASGTMIITPPFTPVNYRCEDFCEMYYVLFSAELLSSIELFTLNEFLWSQPADTFILDMFKRLLALNPQRKIKITDPYNRKYNDSILNHDKTTQSIQATMESDSILKILISRFIKPETETNLSSSKINQKRIIKVLEYIDENIAAPLSLEELAAHVHIHPTYLSNSFREILNIRPTVYIQKKRIEKAQILLIYTEDSIKEICLKVGFNEPDYFHRVFKKCVEKTPGQYRKLYKKNLDECWK